MFAGKFAAGAGTAARQILEIDLYPVGFFGTALAITPERAPITTEILPYPRFRLATPGLCRRSIGRQRENLFLGESRRHKCASHDPAILLAGSVAHQRNKCCHEKGDSGW
jgi:hypothetical protein